jgi:hypothetical protein
MAIKKDESLSSDTETVFRVDNGDLAGLKKVQEVWKLKDQEAALAFALGVLRLAEHNQRLLIEPAGSEKPVPVTPNKSLMNDSSDKG